MMAETKKKTKGKGVGQAKKSTAKTKAKKPPAKSKMNSRPIELPKDEQDFLDEVRAIIDGKIEPLINDALGLFNSLQHKTQSLDVDGNLIVDLETGRPQEDWSKITHDDIETVLMKVPFLQFSLTSLKVDSWAQADLAKMIKKRIYNESFTKQKEGSAEVKKSKAELEAKEKAYMVLALTYAHKRIEAFDEALGRICDRWSRALEAKKEKYKMVGFAK